MTVIGHTPSIPLYTDVAAHPTANASTYHLDRPSNAYDTIITATAIEPNNVSTAHLPRTC